MAQPNYKRETDVLQVIASNPDCRWIWSKHAIQQMQKRVFFAPDIQNALTNGHVELVERKTDDVWRVRGKDLDGNRLVVACVVFDDCIAIRIVTAF